MNEFSLKKRALPTALACGLLALASLPAHAIEFSSDDGEWTGSVDTNLSWGAAWRIKDYELADVGKQANDPNAYTYDKLTQRDVPGRWSANGDDGILNYPDSGDLISNTIKATVEMQVNWRNYGAFFRGSALYDFENADKDVLSDVAQERIGNDARLLDAYIYGNHAVGDRFLNWRLGKQVVSWGESTFIQGGINIINPVDVSKLRVAGAELKEAFEGVNMIFGSIDLTPAVSLEALYMFEWKEIRPDPAGTYFSTNDIATPGGTYAMLGFIYPQPVINPDLFQRVCVEGNLSVSDSPNTPTQIATGCAFALPRSDDIRPSDSGQFGASLRWFLENLGGTELGFYYLRYHNRLPVVSGSTILKTPPGFTNSYWAEYPEDIDLYGVSFNSNVGTWALSGEVSYRPNLPLQIDDVETLFAGLTPLNPLLPSYYFQYKSQVGEFSGLGEYVKGWNEHSSWQAQSTTTKLFGPTNPFKADQIAFVAEVGVNYVDDLPDKDFLRYDGPGTNSGGGVDWTTGDWNNPETEPDGFADDLSWGYRLATRFDYNNAIGAWTVSPRLGWSHDVSGTTPGPGGSFVDGRKQLTLGVAFNYLNQWVVDLAYTTYSGAGSYNQFKNRDFFAASISYSF